MKYIYKLFFLSLLAFAGCLKDDTDLPEQNQEDYYLVYMPQAVLNPKSIDLKFSDEAQSFVFGANYGGNNEPATDISVDFTVNASLVASFNERYGTTYEVLPSSSYTIPTSTAVIPAGKRETVPLEVIVTPENNVALFKSYLLPITMSLKGSEYKINEELKTTYFVVTSSLAFSDFEDYNRSSWAVIDVSSEEPAEGPTNGGLGRHTIDGLNSTFWHTQWSGGSPGPPHHITIDMGATKTLHGFSFIGRQSNNNGKPQVVTIETSTDGTTWEVAESFTLQNINNQQKFFLRNGFVDARYFKVVITSMFGGVNYTHLAELGAF